MGKIFLTSDTHFYHKRILEYEPITRPFKTIEDMNETIIFNWNSVVSNEDTVYVVGDFILGDVKNVETILNRLHGKIILIRGNHDTPAKLKIYQDLGIEVKDIAYIPYKGRFFVLCHFPIATEEFLQMVRNDNSEVIVCYGHIHSKAPKGYIDGTYHVGVDTNDLTPVSLDQIWRESWPEDILKDPEVKMYKEQFS